MIIAVDGPAGAGKSTVCRMLAKELGYAYLDTGAMYRAIAWALLHEGATLEEPQIARHLSRLPLRFSIDNGALTISYKGRGLEEELRHSEIAQWASRISQLHSVRTFLTEWQRRLAAGGRVVAEGRDMATVVFQDAPVKVFLTADLPTRAWRRHAEHLQKGMPSDYALLENQMQERDEADRTRALAPLHPAPGAFIVDTSHMEISEVVKRLLDLVSRKAHDG